MENERSSSLFNLIKAEMGIQFDLKAEQHAALDHLLNRRNLLAVFPTGFGKSVLYGILPRMLHKVGHYTAST